MVPSPNRGTKSIHLPFLQTEAGAHAGLQVSAEKAIGKLRFAIKIRIIVMSIFFICFTVLLSVLVSVGWAGLSVLLCRL